MIENKIKFMNKSTPRLKPQGNLSQITNNIQQKTIEAVMISNPTVKIKKYCTQ